jgi:hypothetical protein
MADAAFVEVFTGNINSDAQRIFTSTAFKEVSGSLYVQPIVFSVSRTLTQVRVDFGRSLRSKASTTVAANYTLTGPTSITFTSVTFTPGSTYLVLDYTGTFTSGTYSMTLASQTVQAAGDDQYNITTGVNLVVIPSGAGSSFNTGFN